MKKYDIVEFTGGGFAVCAYSGFFNNKYFDKSESDIYTWGTPRTITSYCLCSTLEEARLLQKKVNTNNSLRIKRNHGQ